MQLSSCGKPPLRRQCVLVGVFAGLALLAMLPAAQNLVIPFKYYLPLHTVLEFVSILAAFLVFATVWHTPVKEVSASLMLIAVALFAAGWLDFSRELPFQSMPDLVTPASPEKAMAFWLAARLLVALTLFAVSFYPHLKPLQARARYGILAGYTVVNLAVIWMVIFHVGANGGPTPVTSVFEHVIAALLVLAAWRYYGLAGRSDDEFFPWIFGAASISALSQLFFTHCDDVNDIQNLLSHIYKAVSYGLIYQAMFVVSVRKPYLKLEVQAQTLLTVNEKLRTQSLALDSTSIPVSVTDLQGIVTWRNRASYAMMPSPGAAPGGSPCLFSAPFMPEPLMAASVHATVQAGRVWRGLVSILDERGNHITLDQIVSPLRNEEGVMEGFVAVAENVTERANALLRHKRVLDMAIDGFWITDAQGCLLEVNDAYARMSGYPVEQLLSMNISQLEAAQRHEEVLAHIQKIIRLGHDQFETRHRHKQGRDFALDISATYDPTSKQLFIFLRDRSERAHAAAVKRDLERQLLQSQKMQALGQLTGGIAHDFNNILTAILGYSKLALERFAPDKQSKLASYLREVITASDRARDLVAKMSTFARTQPSPSVAGIFPAVVVEEVLAMMRPSIPSSIHLGSRIDDDLPICMDAGELNQMLVNLIINARDVIHGQGMIEIHLHRVELNGQVCAASLQRLSGTFLALEVTDNGSGIAPEHLPHLFEPFFTTKDVGKGTGLGLSMVQGILHRSNGHVVVESRLGLGSRFRLLFPIVSPGQKDPCKQEIHPPVHSGRGRCIWVVDDEPAVAGFFGELLEDYGYKVRLFHEPALALAAFQIEKDHVDLLITDQTMPGMSGLALAARLHGLAPGLPIILCTGYSDGLGQSKLLQFGIRRHFTKPVPVETLLMALAEELNLDGAPI